MHKEFSKRYDVAIVRFLCDCNVCRWLLQEGEEEQRLREEQIALEKEEEERKAREDEEERRRQEEDDRRCREEQEQRRLEEEERLRKEDPKHWPAIMCVFQVCDSVSYNFRECSRPTAEL